MDRVRVGVDIVAVCVTAMRSTSVRSIVGSWGGGGVVTAIVVMKCCIRWWLSSHIWVISTCC
eukprot:4062031-Ditylum_brightwellii.AAC.1